MKYLIPLALLLALLGCEKYSFDPEGIESLASSEEVVEEKPPGFLDQPLKGKVSQRGLYRLVRSSGVVENPVTSTGKAVSKPIIQQVKSTDRIPLVKGARMYLQYRMWSFPNQPAYVELRRVLKHPEMHLPDGAVSTGSDFLLKRKVSANQVISYTGYGFDEDYELVEGEWIFEIWYQDKKLIEQKFVTYWPDKEELAELQTKLKLGNKVLVPTSSPGNPNPRLNWPRSAIGGDKAGEPAGVSDVKKQLADPLVVMDEKQQEGK